VAVIDVAGFVADLKDHAVEHGFHVHDERHFVESYSLRQTWEVDVHPEEGCEGPVDLYLSLEIDPRVLLGFEDAVMTRPEGDDPPDDYEFPLNFTWGLPPLPHNPDLLVLATDLAGIGGPELPLEVSAISVNWETTSASPPVSSSERANFPSSSWKIRRRAILPARRVASSSVSPSATPRRASRPAPISPPGVDRACATRWTTALTPQV